MANLKKHRFDLEAVDGAFFDTALVVPAKKGRFLAFGKLGATAVAIVFRPLGSEAVSVISVRPASRKERQNL